MTFLIILFCVFIFVISIKSRSKQISVLNSTLEQTTEKTKNSLIKDVVLLVIGIILIFVGRNKYIADEGLFGWFWGALMFVIGVVFAIGYLISALKNFSRYTEYKSMNAIQYKKHQELTEQQIKKEDEQAVQAYKTQRRINAINRFFNG